MARELNMAAAAAAAQHDMSVFWSRSGGHSCAATEVRELAGRGGGAVSGRALWLRARGLAARARPLTECRR